ncbi:hypothetical protein KDA14_03445 [Candidatus Saccharibacteria bacterium]|nr:hypothetical protein [Candidatus Saccharibacteria bacterium]
MSSYFSLPDRIIDKVEAWENRFIYGDTPEHGYIPYRYKPKSFTYSVQRVLGILYIGAPFFLGLLLIAWLPISKDQKVLAMFLLVLLMTIVSIVGIVMLYKRGHRP